MKAQRGFTMIEAVLATAISVTVFGMLYWGIAFTYKTFNGYREQMELEREGQKVVLMLRRDLEAASSVVHPDGFAQADGEALHVLLRDGSEVRYRSVGGAIFRDEEAILPPRVQGSLSIEDDQKVGTAGDWIEARITLSTKSHKVERLLVRGVSNAR